MAAQTNATNRLGRAYEAQDSVTLPGSGGGAYTAGDAISDHATTPTVAGYFTLDFKGRPGAAIELRDFTLHKSTNGVTNCAIDVLIFTTVPAVAGFQNDVACAITDAEMLECKGVVKFAAADWTNAITGAVQTVSKTILVVPTSASSTVYGIMLAQGAYTWVNSDVMTLTAHAVAE